MKNDEPTKKPDEVFIRIDLDHAGGRTAFFRMDKDMKDFLNLLRTKEGEDAVQGIILTRDEDDPEQAYHWNIGFILKDIKHYDNN